MAEKIEAFLVAYSSQERANSAPEFRNGALGVARAICHRRESLDRGLPSDANDNWCRFCHRIHPFSRCEGFHGAIGRAGISLSETRSPRRGHSQADLAR